MKINKIITSVFDFLGLVIISPFLIILGAIFSISKNPNFKVIRE